MRTDPDILDLSDEPSPPPPAARRGRGRPKKHVEPESTDEKLKLAQIRLREASARKAEVEVAKRESDLVSAAAVTREWATILRDVRAALLAVPARVGGALPHLTATDIAAVEAEIRAALRGLSDGH